MTSRDGKEPFNATHWSTIILLILKMFVCNCSRKNLNWLDQEVLCPPSRKDTVTALKTRFRNERIHKHFPSAINT